jgi:RNA polymerase sigma factor (sigma-70 family)
MPQKQIWRKIMGFNYGLEKRKFDAEWQKRADEYSAAGFDAVGIQAIRDYDWEMFKARRRNVNREQELPVDAISDDEGNNLSKLHQNFISLSSTFDETAFTGRYDWIESIDNPVLADSLKRLDDSDKELLTLLVFDGYTQTEIAKMMSCTKQTLYKKLVRIKKYLKEG